MSVTIWSEYTTYVLAPGETVVVELRLLQDDGTPAGNVPLECRIAPAAAAQIIGDPKVDELGQARIWVKADEKRAKPRLHVTAGDAEWDGTLFISSVHVDVRSDVQPGLNSVERTLFRMLFWEKDQVRVLRRFHEGFTGSGVFQVQPVLEGVAGVTQIVKTGSCETMHEEKKNYLLFANLGHHAAPILGQSELGDKAAIVYGDAGAASGLKPVVLFSQFFAERSDDELKAALYAIFETGLRRVFRYHSVRSVSYRDVLAWFLPVSLMVSLDDSLPGRGLHRFGNSAPATAKDRHLDLNDLDQGEVSLKPGAILRLDQFEITSLQETCLYMQGGYGRRCKVKVQYTDSRPEGISAGQLVDARVRYVSDRTHQLQFAIRHCLENSGGSFKDDRWHFDHEQYPELMPLLKYVLNTESDFAWGTCHGDLHCDNILLESPENWWLIDYGRSGEGPILFDFIKLEIYLRSMELSRDSSLTANEILAFEASLVEAPFEELSSAVNFSPVLEKAAQVIRTIRRMARRYMVDGMMDYWRLLYGCAIGLTRFYPQDEDWPPTSDVPRPRLEKAIRQMFHVLAVALNVGRLLAWHQVRFHPRKLRLEFVGVGSAVAPRRDAVALDVGSVCVPGVIDHHTKLNDDTPECAASLVYKRHELVTEHLKNVARDDATWIVHEKPDFDCVAATYLAWHRFWLGFFPPGAKNLSDYAIAVDAGAAFLDTVIAPERTPYALLLMHLQEVERQHLPKLEADKRRMQFGFAILDYFCGLEAEGEAPFRSNLIPQEHGFWKAVGHDRKLFESDFDLHKAFHCELQYNGYRHDVKGLFLDNPSSILFKTWARRSGYHLLIVRWPPESGRDHRVVISVLPLMRLALSGLGQALEVAEKACRGDSRKRPGPPRWPDVDNEDPWYDGRSPLHAYTIIDSPRAGTVLSVGEIKEIICSGKWWTVDRPWG